MRDLTRVLRVFRIPAALLFMLAGAAFSQNFLREAYNDPFNTQNCDVEGWEVLFDGTDETAVDNLWISNASHGDGGHWWIDTDPATEALGTIAPGQRVLWSNQNPGGSGGLMYSHRTMENTEVEMGFFPGWRNDGGLFLRSNGRGGAYQIMMDYQPGKTCGGIWPEGISAPSQHNYTLEEEFRVRAEGVDWDVNDWPDIWDPDGYNKVYGKIVGETYIFGYIHDEAHWITDYTQGSNAPELNATGYVGFQIHAGEGSWQGGPNRYSYIKIREIDDNNNPVCIGTRTSSCNIPGYAEYNPNFDIGDPGKCLTVGPGTPGCMYSADPNFNPSATIHAGSMCASVWGCMRQTDPNFNPVAAQHTEDSCSVNTVIHPADFSRKVSVAGKNGTVHISGTLLHDYEMTLIDLSGKVAAEVDGMAGHISHAMKVPEGMYLLRIKSNGTSSALTIPNL